MSRTVLVSAVRTPIGRFQGALAPLPAVALGGAAVQAAVARAAVPPAAVEQVWLGMVLQAGAGQAPARQAARLAGLPWETASTTVNKVCASGLHAIALADAWIRAGDVRVAVAGGMESMSNAPFALPELRRGQRLGDAAAVDLLLHDGLRCAFHGVHMGVHGGQAAQELSISREEQDRWALRSHQRALAAQAAGWWAEEITPVEVPGRTPTRVDWDEGPRADTSLARLAQLPPAFTPDGTITAGNAPGLNDGAAAVVLMAEETARAYGCTPLAYVRGYAEAGAEASSLATMPALAVQRLLKKTGVRLSDIRLLEINEAFAAVVLTCLRLLGCSEESVNVNGGAIALGHPLGASGARLVVTLVHELRRRGGGLGVVALCSGGAQGDAMLLEVLPPEESRDGA
ncbi:MAG: acetyl-CoA C-acetyltransferase [Alicyclobacillus sp.]|nr:acetyl-CoA C-acetyltransferase [Alicyclobacillus sp.]